MGALILNNARILSAEGAYRRGCVTINDGVIADIAHDLDKNTPAEITDLDGGLLLPGFIDVQVNGGGGVLLNDDPSVETMARIAQAHRAFGATSVLPTLISDDLENVERAILAADAAVEAQVPGVIGVHIEGPFLNAAKKGIHNGEKLRPLTKEAVELLMSAKHAKVVLTVAPECVSLDYISLLSNSGVRVCAGHTNASYEQGIAALEAGIAGFTHLFNAMPPMLTRDPGVIPAALESEAWCSLIVDGVHVDAAMLRLALRAKTDNRFMLVTDAMSSAGVDIDHFILNGERINIRDGKCLSDDGTLAGSTLTMIDAVRNAISLLGVPSETAVRMASANPASFLGLEDTHGVIAIGRRADLVWVTQDFEIKGVWSEGVLHQSEHALT